MTILYVVNHHGVPFYAGESFEAAKECVSRIIIQQVGLGYDNFDRVAAINNCGNLVKLISTNTSAPYKADIVLFKLYQGYAYKDGCERRSLTVKQNNDMINMLNDIADKLGLKAVSGDTL